MLRKIKNLFGIAVAFVFLICTISYADEDSLDQTYTIPLGEMEIFSNNSTGGSMVTHTDTRDEFLTDNYGNEYSHSFYAGHGSVTYLTNYMYDTFSGTVAFPKEGNYDGFRDWATLTIYGDDQVLQVFEQFNNLSVPEYFSLDIINYERIRLEWKCEGMNIWEDWGYYATIFDGEFTSSQLYYEMDEDYENYDEDGYYNLFGEYEYYDSGHGDIYADADITDTYVDENEGNADDYLNDKENWLDSCGGEFAGSDISDDGKWYCVSNDYEKGIAVRTKQSAESDIICRLPYGTEFYVDQEAGDWAHTTVNGCSGWIHRDYISVIEGMYDTCAAVRNVSDPGVWYYITSDYAKGIAVRAEPSKDAKLYCRIPYGTEFRVEAFCGVWGFTTVNGYSGWINTDYAQALYSDDTVCELPSDAQGFYIDSATGMSGYILPESEYMYLTEDDADHLTVKGLCYAKNEIYARHGRKFRSDELQQYFNGQTWYHGIYEPGTDDGKVVSLMNKYEQYNIGVLLEMEERLGMYSLD